MNMKLRKVVSKILLLLMILTFCGCQESQKTYEPNGKVVKIGFIGPLNGENESRGRNSLLGAEAALKIQLLLLNGDSPKIIATDDNDDPEEARQAVKKLVEEDGVSAILLGSGSKAVLGVLDLVENYKIPCIALLATHPQITSGEYTSQLIFDDTLQGTVAALYVMDEMIVDRVAVFIEPSQVHSTFLAETFTKKFKEAGGEAEIIKFPSNRSELEVILAGLKARGITFLYLPLHASGVVDIEKISRKLGFDPTVMMSDGILSRIILQYDNALNLVDGMLATDVYSNVSLTEGYGEKLVNVFDKSFIVPKTTYTALGAEGMSILLAAMDLCGDTDDTECINRNVHNTNNFLGVNSKISINSDGKAERPLFINTIVNEKLLFDVMIY